MRKTDINNYSDGSSGLNEVRKGGSIALSIAKGTLSAVWKIVSTVFMVLFISGIIIGISMVIYLVGLSNEPTGIDLHSRKLNLTSFVYTTDNNGEMKEYQQLYSSENRVWVDFNNIPKCMKDAMVAIEDKRFYEHSGVDWVRTGGAVLSLATGSDSYGGSTLTQQLIKNLTNDNEVSISRKLREIFRALNVEKEYTKDEILEAYLNVVNFGSNANGVQAAATLYFNKEIKDCSIAECAAIAAITQNPSRYNPLYYPEYNKERRDVVIKEMYSQEKITKEEYAAAMKESDNMVFVDYNYTNEEDDEEDDTSDYVQNWYIDAMVRQLQEKLAEHYNITKEAAEDKLYTEGLKIYCAMDEEMQNYAERYFLNLETPDDPDLEIGYVLMGLDGRVIASVGSRDEKTGALLWDRATQSVLQPGSTIKPIGAYALAVDTGIYGYNSTIEDEPITKWSYEDGGWVSGPNNWYLYYHGTMTLLDALEWSANATAAQSLSKVGVQNSYSFVTGKLGFKHLTEQDSQNLAGLSIGGLNGGVTVTEMAAAYSIFGTGGKYYEPYTYYYVTDNNDNIILDNRDPYPLQAVTPETAYIMNRMLDYNIQNSVHTAAGNAKVSGWNIIGKTGTTDYDKDSWFCGLSPICAAAIWTGYDNPQRISNTKVSVNCWQDLMEHYLSDKAEKEFVKPSTVYEREYCVDSGYLANDGCTNTRTGYFTEENMPSYCQYQHYSYNNDSDDDYSNNDNNDYEDYSSHYTSSNPNIDVSFPSINISSQENNSSSNTSAEVPSIPEESNTEVSSAPPINSENNSSAFSSTIDISSGLPSGNTGDNGVYAP